MKKAKKVSEVCITEGAFIFHSVKVHVPHSRRSKITRTMYFVHHFECYFSGDKVEERSVMAAEGGRKILIFLQFLVL